MTAATTTTMKKGCMNVSHLSTNDKEAVQCDTDMCDVNSRGQKIADAGRWFDCKMIIG